MHHFKSIFVSLLLVSTGLHAQQPLHYFDPNSKLTWLGLDFTHAKFIGARDEYTRFKMPALLEAWNNLMIDEKNKYSIPKMLQRKEVDISFDAVLKQNAGINTDAMLTEDLSLAKRLTADSIANIISSYAFDGLSGVGLIFNVESFDSKAESARVWITFIDMNTRTVLFTRHLDGKANGTTWRNHWAGAIYNIMLNVREKYYSQWSKKQ